MKDGIYKINENTLFDYMAVKHYGDLEKVRYMTSYEDCLQQIDEWNDEFAPKKKKVPSKHYAGYARKYHVFDQNNIQVASGSGREMANMFGCHVNTIISAANRMVNFQKQYYVTAV